MINGGNQVVWLGSKKLIVLVWTTDTGGNAFAYVTESLRDRPRKVAIEMLLVVDPNGPRY